MLQQVIIVTVQKIGQKLLFFMYESHLATETSVVVSGNVISCHYMI
jgi:hypothetical protein